MPHFSYTLWQGILVYGATGATAIGLTLLCCLSSKEKSPSPATKATTYGSTGENLSENLLEEAGATGKQGGDIENPEEEQKAEYTPRQHQ